MHVRSLVGMCVTTFAWISKPHTGRLSLCCRQGTSVFVTNTSFRRQLVADGATVLSLSHRLQSRCLISHSPHYTLHTHTSVLFAVLRFLFSVCGTFHFIPAFSDTRSPRRNPFSKPVGMFGETWRRSASCIMQYHCVHAPSFTPLQSNHWKAHPDNKSRQLFS